jgi:hypothetical protein
MYQVGKDLLRLLLRRFLQKKIAVVWAVHPLHGRNRPHNAGNFIVGISL